MWYIPADTVDPKLLGCNWVSFIFIHLYQVPVVYGGAMWVVFDEEELVIRVMDVAVEML
jgi:hypothetical protein